MRVRLICCCLAFAAFTGFAQNAEAKPKRIASLNVCAGQLLLSLVDRSRIVSLTFLARDPTASYLHKEAEGIPVNYGLAEEILAVKPDLIVAGRYTTGGTNALLKKLGYRVELFDPDDSLASLRRNILRMAAVVEESERGEKLIAEMDRRLKAVSQTGPGPKPVAVIFRANGFTMGRRSLVNDVLTLAGFHHLSTDLLMDQPGFLSLERLILADPALIIFDEPKPDHPSIAHQLLEHPAMKSLLALHSGSQRGGKKRDSIVVPASLWNCGGPFVVDAVERLARKRQTMMQESRFRKRVRPIP